MKNVILASERVWRAARCERGASMVEFALTFPLVLVLVFATLDLGFMFFEWNAASKATQFGAPSATARKTFPDLPMIQIASGVPCRARRPTHGNIGRNARFTR